MEVVEEIEMSVEPRDEEMEEGEISSESEGPMKPGVELPDLLQELDGGGGMDKASFERMEARAKRFNLSLRTPQAEDMEELYANLGIPSSELHLSREERKHRLESIYVVLQSTTRSVKSKDIYEYFEEFSPMSFEWVSPESINVIWTLPTLASRAMLALSRPIRDSDEDMELHVRSGLDGEGLNEDVIHAKFKEPWNTPIYTREIGGSIVIPDGGPWRFGKPAAFSSFIFMQFASKKQLGNTRSHANIKQEGIISSSLKRKMREAMIQEQELRRQQEERKKYLGPVGKNPWGSIAESWSENRRPVIPVPREVILPSRVRDWDAPTEEMEPSAPRLKRNIAEDDDFPRRRDANKKRKRRDSLSEDLEEDEEENRLSDNEWMSKLKKPRMTMIADAEESKLSCKNRILQGARRRLEDKKIIKILEVEDTDDGQEEPRSITKDLRSRLTVTVDNGDSSLVRHKRDKSPLEPTPPPYGIQSRLGSSLRSRLGERKSSFAEDRDAFSRSYATDVRRKRADSRGSPPQSVDRKEVLSTVVKVEKEPQEDARLKISGRRKKSLSSSSSSTSSLRTTKKKETIRTTERKSHHGRPHVVKRSSKKDSSKSSQRRRREKSSSSESSDSSDSSSSESSSSDLSSNSSSSSSSSYSSSSDSEGSSRNHSRKKKTIKGGGHRRRSRDNSKKGSTISSSKSTSGLRDKLKEYLKQAKERKKPK